MRHERKAGAVPCLAACLMLAAAAATGRESIDLNRDWTFELERTDAIARESGAAPQTVDLPHSWNAADGRDKEQAYHRGVGRYRKTLMVDDGLRGRSLLLYFEGANQVTEVAVNGRHAGGHVGGYTAFAVDISEHVDYGARNEIVVRVDNRHDDEVPPLNADFTFYGGIYRDVRLLVLDEVRFALDRYAANDVRIEPLSVSEERAEIAVAAGIANASDAVRRIRVETALADAGDAEIAVRSADVELPPGAVSQRLLARFEIDRPRLWSPESPQLYRITMSLWQGERLLDRLQYPLGLRWFEFDAARGFRLNGKPYRLFGTNRHQDYPGLGNALPDALHRRDVATIKADGFNFLRLAHYPQDPAILTAADELGLLLWEEIPIVNTIGTSPAFARNSERMLREMIRQHRHHPSVIFWGYMNEAMLRPPEPMPAGYRDRLLALARRLDAVAHSEDPGRATVIALSREELDNGVPLHTVPDALGLNLYFGWYYEEPGALGEFLDERRRRHPGLPLVVSEYGAGSDMRVHARHPRPFDFSSQYQQRFHEQSFAQILARPWLVGSAVWNHFDFGSNHRQDTMYAINQKGLRQYDRRAKDIVWFYRAQLSDEPVLHIAARDWLRRAGSRADDARMPLHVYTNAEAVELLVDGESAGVQRVRNATARWRVRLTPGENVLEARAGPHSDRVTLDYEDRRPLFSREAAAGSLLAVNAGGRAQIVAPDGPIWEADRPYTAGSWGYLGGTRAAASTRILGTDNDPLYQSQRQGGLEYRFDVPDGSYLVTLHVARLAGATRATGDFRIAVNGLTVDIPASAPYTATRTEVLVRASQGNGIRLLGDAGTAEPQLNGIALRRLGGPGAAPGSRQRRRSR